MIHPLSAHSRSLALPDSRRNKQKRTQPLSSASLHNHARLSRANATSLSPLGPGEEHEKKQEHGMEKGELRGSLAAAAWKDRGGCVGVSCHQL